jgi:hypothetical protein
MSTSKIAICNLALSHVGSASRIASIDENTEPARVCKIMYDPSREFVLQDHDWGFAERRELLAILNLTPTGFEYAYQYPTGCLQAREIYQSIDGDKPIDFMIMSQDSQASKMILTNEENAILIYTGDITNTTVFSPAFVMAFSYQLAANISVPITKKTTVKDKMLAYYAIYMDKAALLDVKQSKYTTVQNNDFLEARGYTG